jgi:hypothetical protein
MADSLVYPFKRVKFSITTERVGVGRWLFAVLTLAACALAAWYVAAPGWFAPVAGDNGFSIGGLSRGISVTLLYLSGVVVVAAAGYLLGRWHGHPTPEWFAIQVLGERRLGFVDWAIPLTAVAFFAVKIAFFEPIWVHYLGLALVLGASIANAFSSPDMPVLDRVVLPEPEPGPAPGPGPAPAPDSEDFVVDFEWDSIVGDGLKIEKFRIRRETYETLSAQNRRLLDDDGSHGRDQYPEKVRNGTTDDVRRLVRILAEMHASARNIARLDNMLGFVHQFEYSYDKDSKGARDYARYPIETLVDRTGDCECLSILLVAMMKAHGYRTALIFAPGHCMAGVEVRENIPGTYVNVDGTRYYVCEATARGWVVGEYRKNAGDLNALPLQ